MALTLHTPSRDSRVWLFGMLCSLIAAVGANLDLFPWLPDHWKHGISLASFCVGVFSGKMASSPGRSRRAHREHVDIDRQIKIIRRHKR